MSKYLNTGNYEGKGGRPFGSISFKFSVDEMRTHIEEWKKSFEKDGKRHGIVPTLVALAYDLGTTKELLSRYSHKDDYRPLLAHAKTFCEMHAAQALFNPRIRPAGPIFTLKANHGWKDGTENKDININFSWNTLLVEAEKARKLLEDPDHGGEPIDIEGIDPDG